MNEEQTLASRQIELMRLRMAFHINAAPAWRSATRTGSTTGQPTICLFSAKARGGALTGAERAVWHTPMSS